MSFTFAQLEERLGQPELLGLPAGQANLLREAQAKFAAEFDPTPDTPVYGHFVPGRVEVLGKDDKVLARSEPLAGDLPRGQVKWAEGDIADLKGKTASLRFTLRNGQFYSYWLE